MSAQTRRPSYLARHPATERRCAICGADLAGTIWRRYCFDCQGEAARLRWRRWWQQTPAGRAWQARTLVRLHERWIASRA